MKPIKSTSLAALILMLALSSCGGKEKAATAEEENVKLNVKTATVEERDVADIVTLTASVPSRSSPTMGW